MPVVLSVNNHSFLLRDDEVISRVRSDIERAARAGGAFVTVGGSERAPQVLITPATPVRIDVIDEPEAADDDPGAGLGDFVDYDFL